MGTTDDDELEVSAKLRLDALIGHGTFGKVFRGRQLAVARDVAVKVLHAELALETEPGRLFRDEIRAIGTIDHRNVVRIFDADESRDGRLYFVMELLAGPTLQQIADGTPIATERALSLVAQLLDGLAAVHASGHIHADVKPSNAIVAGNGASERVVLIDFGLSRIRLADRPAEAVGGTFAYMAPEQLRSWEVDARSDVFSAALVLVKLLTGWQRATDEMAPLDKITDPILRDTLRRALADDPQARPAAIDFARALRGGDLDGRATGRRAPFRELAPLTETDALHLHGRAEDLSRLVRRIESSRVVVFTAPSGTGKTSLLRAGLAAQLAARGLPYVYVACGARTAEHLTEAIAPGSTSLPVALSTRRAQGAHLVVILDQVEVALGGGGDVEALLAALVEGGAGIELAVVLGVREDFVARLLNASPALANGVPQFRLGLLDRDGARDALVAPLAEHGVELAAELLEVVLDDLILAGRQLASGDDAVYPPHIQLVGAALFDALARGERRLRTEHYARLGGFAEIVGGHLERTLRELDVADREVARLLFLELVRGGPMRAVRSERDLVEVVGASHGEISIHRVLERLASRRLVARTTGIDGIPSWGLVHDTIVPRIEAWLTVHDLDRRRAAEIVRFHLRLSAGDEPVILARAQLRDLDRFPGLVEEIEAETSRDRKLVWTPRALVQRSRQVQRYRRGLAIGATSAMALVTALLVGSWLYERALREHETLQRNLNIGRVDLAIDMFDLRVDPTTHAVIRVPADPATLPDLAWSFAEPADLDREAAGATIPADRFRRGAVVRGATSITETGIEVRGGDSFAVITGRGARGEHCAASIIPIRQLPGNDHYITPRPIHLLVPTCAASRLDTIDIPAGPFVANGLGTPPSHFRAADLPPRQVITLPEFAIDRTEITNAAFAIFQELADLHEIAPGEYANSIKENGEPDHPRAGLDWFEARAYCRFLGKDLPTSVEWLKAMRGGLEIDGQPNPEPERNFPWGSSTEGIELRACVADSQFASGPTLGRANDPRRSAAVASHSRDRSPYGVMDLAGNMQEWTLDFERASQGVPSIRRGRITRGGNWVDTPADALVDYMADENPRSPTKRELYIGARCVIRAE